MTGCQAGHRFLVVLANGMLQPCSMVFEKFTLEEQQKLAREFPSRNSCDECYVAIRSNLDKSFPQILRENVSRYFSAKAT